MAVSGVNGEIAKEWRELSKGVGDGGGAEQRSGGMVVVGDGGEGLRGGGEGNATLIVVGMGSAGR